MVTHIVECHYPQIQIPMVNSNSENILSGKFKNKQSISFKLYAVLSAEMKL